MISPSGWPGARLGSPPAVCEWLLRRDEPQARATWLRVARGVVSCSLWACGAACQWVRGAGTDSEITTARAGCQRANAQLPRTPRGGPSRPCRHLPGGPSGPKCKEKDRGHPGSPSARHGFWIMMEVYPSLRLYNRHSIALIHITNESLSIPPAGSAPLKILATVLRQYHSGYTL